MDGVASMHQLSALGIMQKISTGNVMVDALVCMLIPLLLTHFMPYSEKMKNWWTTVHATKAYRREIQWIKRDGWYYCRDDDEAPNNILQQAILLYLGTKEDLCSQYTNAQLALVKKSNHKDKSGSTSKDDASDYEDSEYSEDSYDWDPTRQLKQYRCNTIPPQGHWVEVEPGVDFMRVENMLEKEAGKRCDTIINFALQSAEPDGPARIDAFVDKCFSYYKAAMEEKCENTRYLYSAIQGEGGDDAKSGLVYKRYALSNDKSFDCLFHPEKASLLRLVDHFLNGTGKFAIKGHPRKLGCLLSGPPGTGKTSLVKALATYTDRHIISVPLSQIKSNQELQNIMFDQSFKVAGDDLPYSLPFSKTIFVMEDVDAACDVVHRRTPAASTSSPAGKAAKQQQKAAAGSPSPSDSGSTTEPVVGSEPFVRPPTAGQAKGLSALTWADNPDKLSLAGLLNVLDGVVDTPDRIVIMTTNHVEKLDPALIRPGRINKRIHMGYLALSEALQMVEHYMGRLSAADRDTVSAAFTEGLSPAELEMLCCEADTAEQLAALLNRPRTPS